MGVHAASKASHIPPAILPLVGCLLLYKLTRCSLTGGLQNLIYIALIEFDP